MSLKELSNIIFTKGTESENTLLTVANYTDKRILWEGKAKELQYWDKINGWIVVELRVDFKDKENQAIYNKNKIITVI